MLLTADGVGTNEIMRRDRQVQDLRLALAGALHGGRRSTGLLRDKTRPSRIPPLGAEVAERVVALTLERSARRDDALDRRDDGQGGRASASARCSASGARMACSRTGCASSSSPTIPKFVDKLRDVVGLYVDPPAHAIVLSVDEKSQIQALDRTQPGPAA